MKTDISKRTKGELYHSKKGFKYGNILIETDKQVVCRLMEHDYDTKEEAESNAVFIVTACNNFDKLILALKEITRSYEDHIIFTNENPDDFIYLNEAKQLLESIQKDIVT